MEGKRKMKLVACPKCRRLTRDGIEATSHDVVNIMFSIKLNILEVERETKLCDSCCN